MYCDIHKFRLERNYLEAPFPFKQLLNEKQYLAYTTNVERIKKILPNRTSKED
jgi:hypothetical protein